MDDPPEREVGERSSRERKKHVQGIVESRDDVADHPEREVGKGSNREGGDQVQDSKRKTSSPEAGKARLSELRKRMEIERLRVIR